MGDTISLLNDYLYREPVYQRICANCDLLFHDGWECPRCGSTSICYWDAEKNKMPHNIKTVGLHAPQQQKYIALVGPRLDWRILALLIGAAGWGIIALIVYNIFK